MTDFAALKDELAKLGSKLEAFFGAQDPPIQANDQPDVDAVTKQVVAIAASIPEPTAKRPFVKPPAPDVKPADPAPKPFNAPFEPTPFTPANETKPA